MRNVGIVGRLTGRIKAVALLLAASSTLAACSDSATLMEPEVVKKSLSSETCVICEDPNGNVYYNTGHDYGTYNHSTGAYASDTNVNATQNDVYAAENVAFDPYSRDWNNPDIQAVYNWPGAALAGARAAARAGRALARTPQIRQAVTQGARWARDVSVAVAATMLTGWMNFDQYSSIDEVPLSEFEFMFDYAAQ